MFKRIGAAMLTIGLALSSGGTQSKPAGQGQALPAELAWISLFTDDIKKNPRGYWEAGLMKGIVMVYVPAGEFPMGTAAAESGRESDEGPVHRVSTKGIWIGKHEVTRETWHAVMGGAAVKPEARDLPQTDVSFNDVQSFLQALNEGVGLKFRLPTEAEWEKCCRAGDPSPRYGPLDEIAWNIDNSGGRAHPVGTKKPNAFGLFDMLGNVWEWCSDWYGSGYYAASPYLDPAGPSRGSRRVCRGGGFLHGGNYLRSGHRNSQDPAKSRPYLGFRLALDTFLRSPQVEETTLSRIR
jgi:formylglycine-generating enzyme required for sulfatase activity